MRTEATYVPLFSSADGQPFVFWDGEHSRLLIRHGPRTTVIFYDRTDADSCPGSVIPFQLNPTEEDYIYSKGRIIGSYDPTLDSVVIKRDGNFLFFGRSEPPVGYTTIDPVDRFRRLSRYMTSMAT